MSIPIDHNFMDVTCAMKLGMKSKKCKAAFMTQFHQQLMQDYT